MKHPMRSLLLLLLFSIPAVAADDAQEIFVQIYAKRIAAVKATRESGDDVAMAGDLLSATNEAASSQVLFALLCDHAYELSHRHVGGFDTAIRSMQMLARADPSKEKLCRQRLLDVYDRRFRAANDKTRSLAGAALIEASMDFGAREMADGLFDLAAKRYQKLIPVARAIKSSRYGEINNAMQYARHRGSLQRRIALYEKKLKANPKETGAHANLYRIYLMDLDDPVRAADYVTIGTKGDDPARKNLPLAAKPVFQVAANECLSLGDWYLGLASKTHLAKTLMLKRALVYYDRFLQEHSENDLSRTQALLRRKEVVHQLEQSGAASGPSLPPTKPRVVRKPKPRLLTRDPRRIMLILVDKERKTAIAACERFRLRNDPVRSFDMDRKDYRQYHTILCGSNMMDYWGGKLRKAPEAFQWIDAFVQRGGHLVVFGAYNGRNFHHLRRYGIKTGYSHNPKFTEVPGVTEEFFKGCEKLIPPDKKMRSAGNFSCSEPHTVLLRRGDGGPAVVTLPVGKGRLTVTMVEPHWIGDYWLIDVMITWLVRGSPLGEPVG